MEVFRNQNPTLKNFNLVNNQHNQDYQHNVQRTNFDPSCTCLPSECISKKFTFQLHAEVFLCMLKEKNFILLELLMQTTQQHKSVLWSNYSAEFVICILSSRSLTRAPMKGCPL